MVLLGKDIVRKDFLKIFFMIITLLYDIRTKKNDKYVTTLCSGHSTEMNISCCNALEVVCGIPFYSCEVPHPSLPMEQAAITSQEFLDQFRSWFRLWWLRPLSHTSLQPFSQSLKQQENPNRNQLFLGALHVSSFTDHFTQISAQLPRSYKFPEFPGCFILFLCKISKTECHRHLL